MMTLLARVPSQRQFCGELRVVETHSAAPLLPFRF
jgi:hypothetical protein